MATGRVPTTANSPLTAKGDLFTYSTAPARLAVGNSGETIVADSSTSTGLRYTENYAAGKNKIINGDFLINQRAFTSSTASGDTYMFDRWLSQSPSGGTVTRSAETFTLGSAPVAGYEGKTFLRVDVTGQTGLSTDRAQIAQPIESVRTFANQTVTVSFWAKSASGTPQVAVGLRQIFGTGGSPSGAVSTAGIKATISTSWTRYSFTFSVPSISGKTLGTNNNDSLYAQIWFSGGSNFNALTDSLGVQTNTFDIWGVQAEAGSVATAFQTATGTLQGELAACQRYFQTIRGFSAIASGTTAVNASLQFPVCMRAFPSVAASSTLQISDAVAADFAQSSANVSITNSNRVSNEAIMVNMGNFTGLTSYRIYNCIIKASDTGAIQLNAEL